MFTEYLLIKTLFFQEFQDHIIKYWIILILLNPKTLGVLFLQEVLLKEDHHTQLDVLLVNAFLANQNMIDVIDIYK
jgi:hypothetical protein